MAFGTNVRITKNNELRRITNYEWPSVRMHELRMTFGTNVRITNTGRNELRMRLWRTNARITKNNELRIADCCFQDIDTFSSAKNLT